MTRPLESKVPVGLPAALAEVGVSPAAVLTAAGLPARLFDATVVRLPVARYFDLWRAIRAVSGDPSVGLRLVQRVRAELTEPLFLALLCARDLGAAADAVARYKRMLSPEALAVSRDGAELTLEYVWSPEFGEPPQALVDAELGFLVEVARRATRELGLSPLRLSLRATALDPGAQHADFFRCPVVLGAPSDAVTFGRDDAHRPFLTHNPSMLQALDPYLRAQTPTESPLARLRAALAEGLRGRRMTVRSVARDLALSSRSLQRMLTEHGTTFRAELDAVRNQHALAYLRGSVYSDAEVAWLLGYEDPNSFYRAFRGWNGFTPAEARRRAQA